MPVENDAGDIPSGSVPWVGGQCHRKAAGLGIIIQLLIQPWWGAGKGAETLAIV